MNDAEQAMWPRACRVARVATAFLLCACVGQPPAEVPWDEDGGAIGVDSAVGQVDSATPPWLPDAAPPDAELPPESINPTRMYEDVVVLASDELAGREPGTQGNELTMQLVESVFAEYGLEPLGDGGTYRQSFSYYTTEAIAEPELSIGGKSLRAGSDFALARGSGSGVVRAEIVFVGYGLTVPPYDPIAYPECPIAATGYDDYQGLDLTGKVALVMSRGFAERAPLHRVCPAGDLARGRGSLWDVGYKAANASSHGAVALIVVADEAARSSRPIANVSAPFYDPTFPVLVLDRSAASRRLPQLDRLVRRIDVTMQPGGAGTAVVAAVEAATALTYGQTANIVGAVLGSDPSLANEVVVIGGHLDHLGESGSSVYHGADDNASGTAVTLELARMAARSGVVPKRTLVFAGFNAEEMGLIGSCHMARNFMYPLDDVVLMLSLDMVGAGNESGISLVGGLESKNSWFGDLMRSGASTDGLDYEISESWSSGGSDHVCFDDRGVSAMMVMSKGSHPYYHTPSDTADNIQAGNLEATARTVWSGLRQLAQGTDQSYSSYGSDSSERRGAKLE